jgi:anti-sigma factor RsiW
VSDDRHQELRLLVQADCDGELAPRDAAVVAAHLEDCADCRALHRNLLVTKESVHANVTYHEAPDHFRRQMETMLAANAPKQPRRRRQWGGWIGSFGVGAALAAILVLLVAAPRNDNGTEQMVLDGHLRALQSGHLYEVASSDQHTVKPWFDGRLDFAPPVKDLAARGFPLKGGRLDIVDGRAVAALVYNRAKHVIDLYIVHGQNTGEASPREATRNGYNIISWSDGEIVYWAVSDLNLRELGEFVRDWRATP